MSYFTDFVRGFLDLGATVILPVVIFLLGLFFRQKIGAAFRSGLTIGVAFVGIFLVIDLLVKNLGPAAQAMVKNLGVSLNVIDVGWPATSSIAWASSVAAFIIPLGIIVNVVLLVTKVTKTMNVDIWNFWHYTFTSSNGLCRIRQYLASVISSSYFPSYLFESSRLDSTDDE